MWRVRPLLRLLLLQLLLPVASVVLRGGDGGRIGSFSRVAQHADPETSISLKSRVPSAAGSIGNVSEQSEERIMAGYVPIFMPSESAWNVTPTSRNSSKVNSSVAQRLVRKHITHKFSSHEAEEVKYAQSHGLQGDLSGTSSCTTANTIFDLGFYDGADSRAYLTGGYCVVGVEADPDLVNQAVNQFAVFLTTGQLRLANVAIAPLGESADWKVFYRSKCTKEWNSFYQTVGCRACAPPHAVDLNMCEQVGVAATDCAGVFATFGVPSYLKLDIEGAETGCFQAMMRFPPGSSFPMYVSAEITQVDYITTLASLGYQGFKLVRQDRLATQASSQTGPWGDAALDCRAGILWRPFDQVFAEMTAILQKQFMAHDPCPGGVLKIHGNASGGAASIWYDLHATLQPPTAPR